MPTPAERAEKALRSASEFCDLLADAGKLFAHPLSWAGSAFRDHPVGLIDGTIKMTNEWRVGNGCRIEITDGEGWDAASICRQPAAYGNAHPQPIKGSAVLVWRSGQWTSEAYEAALRPRMLTLLEGVAEWVERVSAERDSRQRAQAIAAAEARDRVEAAALAKAAA